jgi:hypothetical protein
MSSRRPLFAVVLTTLIFAPSTRAGAAPDHDHVARLISSLGSDRFAERKKAAAELERIGGPALPGLRRATAAARDEEACRLAADLVARIENSLDQLLADYRAYGLPLPPPDGPLVRHQAGSGRKEFLLTDGKLELHSSPPSFQYAFLVAPGLGGRPPLVQHGTSVYLHPDLEIVEHVDPRHLTPEDLRTDQDKENLALALILHARSWAGAKTLLALSQERESSLPPRTTLRLLAWDYWTWHFRGDNTWHTAASRLKTLLADEPRLDTPANRRLLASLAATLKLRPRPENAVERVIDNLTEVSQVRDLGSEGDEHFNRALLLGFEAVPTLIGHLTDDRLTYHVIVEGGVEGLVRVEHSRVGDVASALLRTIAGENASADWPDHKTEPEAERKAIESWWAAARAEGEEAYIFRRLNLPPPHKGETEIDYYRRTRVGSDRSLLYLPAACRSLPHGAGAPVVRGHLADRRCREGQHLAHRGEGQGSGAG